MEDTTGGCCSTADETHWDESLVVLTDGAPIRPKLRAVSAAAAREGVRAGMSLSEARALCANLDVWTWNDDAVSAGITAATAMYVAASPQVSPVAGAPGMWWIGASGFAVGARAAGGAGERVFANALLAIARRWHPHPRVAIADTCACVTVSGDESAPGEVLEVEGGELVLHAVVGDHGHLHASVDEGAHGAGGRDVARDHVQRTRRPVAHGCGRQRSAHALRREGGLVVGADHDV